MSFISLSQAHQQWEELAADIPANDKPARAASWNDYTDFLCKNGQLCALQYRYAPAYDEPMPGEGSRWDALSNDREFILNCMGFSMKAEFVPFSKSRNAKEKNKSLNWRIVLLKNEKEILTSDYAQGIAHCPAYKNPSTFENGKRDNWMTEKRIALECETGKISLPRDAVRTSKDIEPPTLVDVLYSLLIDAGTVDYSGFEDWCEDYGYSSDSISARRIYDECVQTGLKIMVATGKTDYQALQDLFAGM